MRAQVIYRQFLRHTADDEYEDIPYQAFIEKGERKGMIESYSYFLSACDVKFEKKKWRPFTLDEFLKRFPLLSLVTFRKKRDGELRTYSFIGYSANGRIILGHELQRLDNLFEDLELKDEDGNWTPFGVEE